MQHAVNWFEIPVSQFDRAFEFYTRILDSKLTRQDMPEMTMGIFPHERPGIGGAIVKHAQMAASGQGTLVYLNGGDDLQPILDRIGEAGGEVIMPKTHLGDTIGAIAIFKDCEGNHVGLHSHR